MYQVKTTNSLQCCGILVIIFLLVNMRVIKFRMWSKEAKKFFYDPENVYECLKFSQLPTTANFSF